MEVGHNSDGTNKGVITGFTSSTGKTLTVDKTITLTSADDTSVITLPSSTKTLLATDGSAASLTNFPNLNQDTTGNADTASALATSRAINGINFDGTAPITVPSNIVPGSSGYVMTSNGSVWTSAPAGIGVAYLKGELITGKVTITTATKTIVIAKDDANNNIYVTSPSGALLITPTTLNYTDGGANYVFADSSNGALSVADYNTIATFKTNKNLILLFSFFHNLKKLTAVSKQLFTIDGVSIAEDYFFKSYLKGELIQGVVTIDTTAKTVILAREGIQNIYAIHTQGLALINPITLNYTDGGFNYIYLDIVTSLLSVANYNTIATYKANKNMCMIFCFYSNLGRVYAEHPNLFTINGLKNGGWTIDDGTLYNTAGARIVMPDKLYLLKDTPYSILGANILSPLPTWDTARVNFELPLLSDTSRGSAGVKVLVSEECELNTQLAVNSNGYTGELFKNISIIVKDKANIIIPVTPIRVLHIGDSLTNECLPPATKWWLTKLGISSQMVGTVDNNYVYDYPIPNLPNAASDILGEGRGGWCLTDFTGGRTYVSGGLCMRYGNPFWNPAGTPAFDAQYYLDNNPVFTGFDFVTIWLGVNDLSYASDGGGLNHPNHTVETPVTPVTVAEVYAYFASKLDIMIASFQSVNANVKIAIMPPPRAGMNTVYGERYRILADILITYYAGREDVIILGNYMSIGLDSGIQRDTNVTPNETRSVYSASNNTLLGVNSGNVHFGGHTQLSNACWIASWIANML